MNFRNFKKKLQDLKDNEKNQSQTNTNTNTKPKPKPKPKPKKKQIKKQIIKKRKQIDPQPRLFQEKEKVAIPCIRSDNTTYPKPMVFEENEKSGFSRFNHISLILDRIFSYLSSEVIVSKIGLCCKQFYEIVNDEQFWKNRMKLFLPSREYEQIFLEERNKDHLRAKDLYIRKVERVSVASSFWVVHLGNQYWIKQSSRKESPVFGEYVYLRNVCWLQVQGGRCLKKGRYNFSWRLKRSEGCNLYRNITFQVTTRTYNHEDGSGVGDEQSVYSHSLQQEWQQWRKEQWFYYTIGSNIEVKEDSHVCFKILDYTGSWKYGISLDYVKIERVQK